MYEVSRSAMALRLGIDNTPSDKILEVAEQTCILILQPVRDEFGSLTPTSWYRCEKLEKKLCWRSFLKWADNNKYSHDTDQETRDLWNIYFELKSHPKGEGVDFEKIGTDNRVIYDWCKDNLPIYDQLIAEFMKKDSPSAGWIHGSYSTDNNRMQLKEAK